MTQTLILLDERNCSSPPWSVYATTFLGTVRGVLGKVKSLEASNTNAQILSMHSSWDLTKEHCVAEDLAPSVDVATWGAGCSIASQTLVLSRTSCPQEPLLLCGTEELFSTTLQIALRSEGVSDISILQCSFNADRHTGLKISMDV